MATDDEPFRFLSDNGASDELGPSEAEHTLQTRDGQMIQYCGGPDTDCPFAQPGPETELGVPELR